MKKFLIPLQILVAYSFLFAQSSWETIHGDHVMVHYQPSVTTHVYANSILAYAEESWAFLSSRGYHMPPDDLESSEYYLDIDIDNHTIPNTTIHSNSNDPDYPYGSSSKIHMTLSPPANPTNLSGSERTKAAIFHELFHAVQFGYHREIPSWIDENFCVWMENHNPD